jgi:hypothetical protein
VPEVREASASLAALIAANAPLWAAEAEVFRTYWDWPRRSRASDRRWLARQCYKELFDGFVPRLRELRTGFAHLDGAASRWELLCVAEGATEELAHYCLFADAHDAIRASEPRLSLARVEKMGNWPENAALGALRARHRRRHGELGRRAQAFTEGGYCTLYAEGMRLAGRGGADDVIAAACRRVYDDEWDHMIAGIAGLDDARLSSGGWALLTEMTVAQMRLRVRMRNAQFGRPLSESRLAEIDAGEVEPLAFDWDRAGLRAPRPLADDAAP